MYYCQVCGSLVPPCTPSRLVVVKTRRVRFPYRKEVNPTPHLKPKLRDDPGGEGTQIVRELRACPGCATSMPAEPFTA
ncbi:MAG: hypothetical protein AMXMBFR47_09350 [Planctomycetota bacterium]